MQTDPIRRRKQIRRARNQVLAYLAVFALIVFAIFGWPHWRVELAKEQKRFRSTDGVFTASVLRCPRAPWEVFSDRRWIVRYTDSRTGQQHDFQMEETDRAPIDVEFVGAMSQMITQKGPVQFIEIPFQ